jgi:NO-binding membrane sensor protein with MHYT domain
MHYTDMLSFKLPVPVHYHWPTALLSLLVGIIGSAASLLALSRRRLGRLQICAASIALGLIGISALHYSAMTAMRLQGEHHHSLALASLSVVLVIGLSFDRSVPDFSFSGSHIRLIPVARL